MKKEKEENKRACSLRTSSINNNVKHDLSLLHIRLGHLSLGKMKHLNGWKFENVKKYVCFF